MWSAGIIQNWSNSKSESEMAAENIYRSLEIKTEAGEHKICAYI